MARGKKHTAEQIVNLLRQVEVGVANGKTMSQACSGKSSEALCGVSSEELSIYPRQSDWLGNPFLRLELRGVPDMHQRYVLILSTRSRSPLSCMQFQPQLDAMLKADGTRFHLMEGAPPVFENYANRTVLHFTMRNTLSFETGTSSIYKRAAQTFDLFLAPELNGLLKKLPANAEYDSLDFSVRNRLGPRNLLLKLSITFVL